MEPGRAEWHRTACVLCAVNCGIEVRLGGPDGRHFEKVRGDPDHPASRGYVCDKPGRLDHYQNSPDRIHTPLRRRPDGSFEPVSWEVAIAEVAQRFAQVRDRWGGPSILYYGGGGQGNHLGGSYAAATRRVLGVRYRSNALAQEKTGEMWVNDQMFGGWPAPDFERCDVALVIGKNPWQSHGFQRARVVVREIARDPARTLIVVDPRRSETAELADFHLALKPGTDAWLLAGLLRAAVDCGLPRRDWLESHAGGVEQVLAAIAAVDVAACAEACGVPVATLRAVGERIARAERLAVIEDLGLQMSLHSTLSSYLEKLLWVLGGHYGRPGTHAVPTALVGMMSGGARQAARDDGQEARSPVAHARIINDMVPCNVIAGEILSDHPARYRAMLVESANPAHSVADSQQMREALRRLELLVVIDVAMTETARLADYVLPAATQYEKCEATFFNFEWPANVFHLRHPVLEPPEGVLTEAEIHTRIVEALGALPAEPVAELRAAAAAGPAEFGGRFTSVLGRSTGLKAVLPCLLYRALGPALGKLAPAAVLLGIAQGFVAREGAAAERAGWGGRGAQAAAQLFAAMCSHPSGVVFSVDDEDAPWRRVRTGDGRIQLAIPELLEMLAGLPSSGPARDPDFPLVLSAGERRSDTANTILRDPRWRKKDAAGVLRVSPADAVPLGLSTGDVARLSTRRGSLSVQVEVTDSMQAGHMSLPNGLGVDFSTDAGIERRGAPPNELTDAQDRDPIAGTPWHKHVPARLERAVSAA